MSQWREVQLGDICTFRYGKALPEASRNGGEIPVYGSNGIVGAHDRALTNGPTIIVGRKGSYGEVNFSERPCWPIDTTYFIDELSTDQDLRWLAHRLPGLQLNTLNKSAAVPGLNREDAYRQRLLLPPLPEQRRIAAILDQADALRAKRREALAQLDHLTQAIFIDMFGDPVTNPGNWPSLPLTQACHCYSGGTPSKENADYWGGTVPWFSPKDLKKKDLFDSIDHIASKAVENTRLRLLPADTVVIVVRGMILAHTFPVSLLRIPATINQDLKALLPRVPLRSQFLATCLRAQSANILGLVSEAGHGTKRLDADGLSAVRILLPEEKLQEEFETRIATIDLLRSQMSSGLTNQTSLFSSLQHRAFRGEL